MSFSFTNLLLLLISWHDVCRPHGSGSWLKYNSSLMPPPSMASHTQNILKNDYSLSFPLPPLFIFAHFCHILKSSFAILLALITSTPILISLLPPQNLIFTSYFASTK